MDFADQLHLTLHGLAEHGLWSEVIPFGMRHLHAVRRERPLLKLLVDAYCREIFRANPEQAVELDRMFRSLAFPEQSPFGLRWKGCRQKALGRTPYAEWMARGRDDLNRGDGHAAMACFAEALKLDPWNLDAKKGQERALFHILRSMDAQGSGLAFNTKALKTLMEHWLPRLTKPSVTFSKALDLLSRHEDMTHDWTCMAHAPFDWPIPFWRKADTKPTRKYPWSLLGHQIRVADRAIGGLVASLYEGEEDPVTALPDEGKGILDWAHALRPHIPAHSPARLRLSDFHRHWGSQEYADKLLFAYMKRQPGCPLAWLHFAVSFCVPHKISYYLSGLCKAALLLTPEHPMYVRTHLFLAKEYQVQGKTHLAKEELQIAKGGKTRIPLDRFSFPFRNGLLARDDGKALSSIPPETLARYSRTAAEAESFARSAME